VFVAHKHDGSKIVTKHLWGKLLKRKSDANTAVSEILAHTRNFEGMEIAMFISDNGGEHVNELTMRTMAEKGVKVVLSTPENQNQDPTERHIGIINKLVVKMLHQAQMDIRWWCYAFTFAINVLNLWPATAGVSKHESFYGSRPCVKNNVAFGTVCLCRRTKAKMSTGGFSPSKIWNQSIVPCRSVTIKI
jgi:hypothetical protein